MSFTEPAPIIMSTANCCRTTSYCASVQHLADHWPELRRHHGAETIGNTDTPGESRTDHTIKTIRVICLS